MCLVFQIEQLHKIYKLCGSPADSFWKRTKLPHATSFKPQHTYEATLRERCKELSTSGVFLLETLLSMEADKRGTASSALNSEVNQIFNFLFLLFFHLSVFFSDLYQSDLSIS